MRDMARSILADGSSGRGLCCGGDAVAIAAVYADLLVAKYWDFLGWKYIEGDVVRSYTRKIEDIDVQDPVVNAIEQSQI